MVDETFLGLWAGQGGECARCLLTVLMCHEALLNIVVVKAHRHGLVAASSSNLRAA
jgi:hypothetical protein